MFKGKADQVDKKNIFVVINPSSGKDEPVLEIISRVFKNSDQQPTVHVLTENEDPAEVIRRALPEADLIAVYGGDGSVTKAAAALINSRKPLAIIPGGTANVLSKELGIPQGVEEALILINDGNYQLRTIDTGLVNNKPFLLRINFGIMAEMITKTDPDLKDNIGQLAYGVSTIKSIMEAQPVNYLLNLDGEQVDVTGVSLTITNSGSVGIGSLQLRPGISVSDGLLDVVMLKNTNVFSLIKAAGGTLFGNETEEVIHWTCKEIKITLSDEQLYLCDDFEAKARELTIKVVSSSLVVAVPLNV
jgi:diacylglycerol kinase (ATP)